MTATIDEASLKVGLEDNLLVPVIDNTGLTGRYDFSMAWPGTMGQSDKAHLQAVEVALRDHLGLELVPTNAPVEVLFVEKEK